MSQPRRPETGAREALAGDRPRLANLKGLHIGIDARYLKRRGVGISWYLHQGIGDLLAAQARLTLVTDDENQRSPLQAAYPSAGIVALPGRSGFAWEQNALRRHLAGARYDAYVAPANYGLPLRYRGATKLILVVHDLIPLRLPHLYLLPRPLWAGKYLLSLVIAAWRADRIVAVSDATARDVTRLLRKPAVDVVYPQVPQPYGEPASGPADGAGIAGAWPLGKPAGSYFVYNGGSDIRKNVPTMLRAFSQVRDQMAEADLVILGTGYDGFTPMIRRLGIADHVFMPGYVDEAAKVAILTGALAVVYPSRLEGFGLPVVEALAAGIPVVAGTGGALPEIGGDAATYVARMNTRSLADAMTMVTDANARRQAQEAGAIQLTALRCRQEAHTLAHAIAACLASAGSDQTVS